MSLWKQFSLVIIILFSLIFAGILIISVHSMHKFVTNQLAFQAQNTASYLGLTISNIATHDISLMRRTIDAIFDRGYYKRITVEHIEGDVLYDNIFTDQIKHAPNWFINFINIKVQNIVGVAILKTTDGWHNYGKITVIGHPGYVYFELWNIVVKIFWLFLLCTISTLLLAIIAAHILLSPLRAIAKQAAAICNQDFIVQGKLPWTTDFKILVMAINNLSNKLRHMFQEHIELNHIMRTRSYQEITTGLGNKRYLYAKLDQILSSTESGLGGVIGLRVENLSQYLTKHGQAARNNALKHIANIISQLQDLYEIPVMSHVYGTDFIFTVMNIDKQDIAQIHARLTKARSDLNLDLNFNLAAVWFNHNNYVTDLLDQTMDAIIMAEKQENNNLYISSSVNQNNNLIAIKDWNSFLINKIEQQDIILQYQPVFFYTINGTILFHHEALLRIYGTEKELLCAGIFLPIAYKMQLGIEFDKLVISQVIARIQDNLNGTQRYGINLSEQTIQDPKFLLWFSQQCSLLGVSANRLTIEIPEYIVKNNIKIIQELMTCVKTYNIQVGLDHFGCGFSSYGYLEQLKFDYIKIDGSYIRDLHNSSENKLVIKSFMEIAHGLDILVIATTVETEAEKEALLQLKIEGMQGFFIGQPV